MASSLAQKKSGDLDREDCPSQATKGSFDVGSQGGSEDVEEGKSSPGSLAEPAEQNERRRFEPVLAHCARKAKGQTKGKICSRDVLAMPAPGGNSE